MLDKAALEEIERQILLERERCAKIAERPRIQDAMIGEVSVSAAGREIAAEIRSTPT